MPISCSPRLGVIEERQFQAALDRFDLGRFICAEPAKRGMFGQNVFLTSTTGRFVLRGSPHSDAQLAHERFFARILHERSQTPVPWPYRIDEGTDIFGWSYALMPCMPGLHLDDEQRAALTVADRVRIAAAMGSTLAQVAGVPWEASGRFDLAAGTVVPARGGYVGELGRELRELLDHALRLSPSTIEPDLPAIERLIGAGLIACAGVTASPTTTDFGETNATVERVGNAWRCSGVFDFFEWLIGDAERALVRPALWYADTCRPAATAFLGAYHAARGLRPGAAARLSLYVLADRLIFWNFGHSQAAWWAPDAPFRPFLEPAVVQITDLVREVSPAAAALP
jgi:Ser/Thr protein kinase RdoA (MazF antagonist)